MFPTCVGMNRFDNIDVGMILGVPHMRGDEPEYTDYLEDMKLCSPHAWG